MADISEEKEEAVLVTKSLLDNEAKEHSKAGENTNKLSVPDQKDSQWSWVVCFACFTAHVVFDGIYLSVGIVFVELLEHFDRSKRDTAVVVSLCFGVAFLSGPIYAFLCNRFGCRAIVIIGSLLCSASYCISILAPSIYVLYLTFGVMAGFGYGCVYLPSVICVNYYFKKRRALATGLGVCGSGIGVVIFGPITRFLIDLYTWRGAILVQGGLLLHGVLCGLVYRPIEIKENSDDLSVELIYEYNNDGNDKVEHFESTYVSSEIREYGDVELDENETETGEPMNQRLKDIEMLYMPTKDNEKSDHVPDEREPDSRDINNQNIENSDIQMECKLDATKCPNQNGNTTTSYNKALYSAHVSAPSNKRSSCLLTKDINETHELGTQRDVDFEAQAERLEAEKVFVYTVKENCHDANPERCDDGDRYKERLETEKVTVYTVKENCHDANLEYCDNDDKSTDPCIHGRRVTSQDNTNRLVRVIRKNFDISIFRSVPFLLQMFATALYTFTYLTPYVFLPDKARQIGVDDSMSAWLISSIGFSNTFGRILAGLVSDVKGVNRLYVFIAALSVCGFMTCLMTAWQSIIVLFPCAVIFGLCSGTVMTLNPVLLTDIVGRDRMAEAYGSSNFFCGSASLLGAPIIGWLCDVTGTYNASFLTAGLVMISGSALVGFIPLCRLKNSKKT